MRSVGPLEEGVTGIDFFRPPSHPREWNDWISEETAIVKRM